MRTLRAAIALTALFLLVAPARAQTQQPNSVGVEIQPSIVEKDLPSRDYSTPILFVNHEKDAFDLSLRVEELGHDLDGTPRFSASSKLASAFHLSATKFRLAPGARKQIQLSGSIPSGQPSAYFGVVTLLSRVGASSGSNVTVKTQEVAEFLLRGPKPWVERLTVADVGVLPGSSKQKTVYATVKNIGNVHVRPRGEIKIFRGSTLLATVKLELGAGGKPPAVLPTCGHGCARRLKGTWNAPAGITGKITLRATLSDPEATGQRTVNFTAGHALEPAAKITFQHVGTDAIVAQVANVGSVTLSQSVLTVVATQDGKFERGRKIFPMPDLPAAHARDETWKPSLADGTYTITAQIVLGDKLLDQAVASLQVGAPPKTSRSPVILYGVAGVLLLLVLIVLFFFIRKRRDGSEETAEAS